MYATINLPGSSHFEHYGPNTRAECEAWLEERRDVHQRGHGGVWVSTYMPARVITNAVARAMRYRDGSPVIRTDDE